MSNRFADNVDTTRLNDNIGFFFVRFFKILGVHRLMFGIVFLLTAALVIFYYLQQPQFYRANYDVFYNETMREFVDDSRVPYVQSDFDKNYWLKSMNSDDLFQMIIESSGFTYTVPQLKGMFNVHVLDKRREDRIPVFRVSIVTENRKHIPILIRTYVQSLNQLLIQHRTGNSESLITYLQDQIRDNNAKLSQIDVKIMSGNIQGGGNEIVDFDKIRERLDLFRKELLQARVNLASIKAARERTEFELQNLDGTIVNESAFTEPLKVQLMNLQLDLARSLTRNKESHPEVKQIRQNIGKISDMLNDSLTQRMEIKSLVMNPLKGQLMSKLLDLQINEVSESTKVKSLERVIEELEKRTLPNAINEGQQRRLRNREMIYLTIKQLNDKLIGAQSVSQGSLSRFVFIDDANSIFVANKSIYFYSILALCIALIIASLLVFLYDLLDDRLMILEDYLNFYKVPVIGMFKHYKAAELESPLDYNQINNYHMRSDMGNLVVNFKMFLRKRNVKSVVITSPDRGEGKSLISLRIAAAMAAKQYKVLLVDMDFFAPKLSEKLKHENTIGISNHLSDERSISDVIIKSDIEGLDFIPAGTSRGKKELFYSNPMLKEFLTEMSSKYDLIFFDTPAASYIPDTMDFFDLIDHMMVVVRLRKTSRLLLNRFFSLIAGFREDQMHVVINDLLRPNKDSKGYGYEYYMHNKPQKNVMSHVHDN